MTAPLVIDTHMHLYRSKEDASRAKASYEIWEYGSLPSVHFSAYGGDPDDARLAMADAGASYAIVTNLLDAPTPKVDPGQDLLAYNHWLCDLAARSPELIPYLAVDPGRVRLDDLVAHIREMVLGHGAQGIKLHPPLQRLELADRGVWRIFELCCELDIGIVSHSGPSRSGMQYGEPAAFRQVLAAFPGLRISLAHLGGGAWRQTAAIARDFPHVYFDCCEIIEWLGAPGAPSPEEFVALVREVGVERVMMGSDFPWYDIDHTVGRIFELPGLGEAEKRLIVGENAARFLRLAT